MAENVEKSIENIVNELKRLQDCELQIAEALRKHGLTLVKTAAGYDVMSLGEITAQSEKKSPEQSDQPRKCRECGYERAECPRAIAEYCWMHRAEKWANKDWKKIASDRMLEAGSLRHENSELRMKIAELESIIADRNNT